MHTYICIYKCVCETSDTYVILALTSLVATILEICRILKFVLDLHTEYRYFHGSNFNNVHTMFNVQFGVLN